MIKIESKIEINDIKKFKKKNNKKDLMYQAGQYKYGFRQYKTIRYIGENINTDKTNIDEVEMDQTNLSENMAKVNDKFKTRSKEDKEKKEILMKAYMLFRKVEN